MRPNVENVDFSNVGGLEEHIRCLREMVIFPLLYRELYDKFRIKPPRGILFYGPPGTGKTLVARALSNECSKYDREVAFFSRKGAECLSKWVGESEKSLRKLFESAQRSSPSIIFFDEIDGLAPIRSSQQDPVHSSMVSTLLALMDGLDTLRDVIVIGATNRIDVIDPALRRPGRFDRELYFSPPAVQARRDILHVYVNQWDKCKPDDIFINDLASNTVGYCGSDLRALCTEAVMCAVRRRYPKMYTASNKINIDSQKVEVERCDFLNAKTSIVPSSCRTNTNPAKKLPDVTSPLLQRQLKNILNQLLQQYPYEFLKPQKSMVNEVNLIYFPRLLITGKPMQGQTTHIAPAILQHFEHLPIHTLDIVFFMGSSKSYEELFMQKVNEVRRNIPAILYMPDIINWWKLLEDPTRDVLFEYLNYFMRDMPLLLLATADHHYVELDCHLQELFNMYQGQVIQMENPNLEERTLFLKPLFKNIIPPPSNGKNNHDDDTQSRTKSDSVVHRTRCSRRLRGEEAENFDLCPPAKRRRKSDLKEELKEEHCRVRIKQEPGTSSSFVNNAYCEPSCSDVGEEFKKLLKFVVNETENCPLHKLEILYGGLNNCILSYKQTSDRPHLYNILQHNINEFIRTFKLKSNGKWCWSLPPQD